MRKYILWAWATCGLLAFGQTQFEFTYDSSIPSTVRPQVEEAMVRAGNAWSEVLLNPVTIEVEIRFFNLGSGSTARKALGSTTYYEGDLSEYTTALNERATSANDASAAANVPDESVPIYINYTANNPNGAGSTSAYLDDDNDSNNTTIRVPFALGKAMELGFVNFIGADQRDGLIRFNNQLSFDYDLRDGVEPPAGTFDFVTTAIHELGHILGFASRFDTQFNTRPSTGATCLASTRRDDEINFLTPLDLFTYSTESAAMGAIDYVLDSRVKFFSINGGTSALPAMSNGVVWPECSNGTDGFTRGHWQERSGLSALGVMDPTTVPFQTITINDLTVMDVIGWDLSPMVTARPTFTSFAIEAGSVNFTWTTVQAANYQVFAFDELPTTDDPLPVQSLGTTAGTTWSQALTSNPIRYYLVEAVPQARAPVTDGKIDVAGKIGKASNVCESSGCGCLHGAIDYVMPDKTAK